ncbi:glycosyltransferase family 2 protein [Cyanobium sp. N.Huapi 1H5]|uniref:glycosyltransferase family 2 protein n=1 Tax=Cyanobium sp. N.Huapi 1H5 TaxID=2823719 RepID=UPI0020CD56C0|nr:glycosyltransferase family 2 protein [Cyanobium sp. N.Huapi 1H5]MCP9837699.1 glycosyltransferase family 2 protein [Cyanobium sp. N.Huapi 1H5]
MSRTEPPAALLTALILTHNEEANIGRTLDHLGWLDSILVIDSGSSDATLAILAGHPSVRVLHRPFDSFADQCNFGLDQIGSPWVLSLDADYLIPPPLAAEIQAVIRDPAATAMAGYAIPFRYCIGGRPLRSGMLPPRTSLYRRGLGRYRNDGHGHRIVLTGPVGRLRQPIFHDDRKPLQRWLASQGSYLAIEAAKLRATPWRQLSLADRLRKHTPLAPYAALLFCLVWKGGMLEGWRGWAYAQQRMYAELLLHLMLLEDRCSLSTPP